VDVPLTEGLGVGQRDKARVIACMLDVKELVYHVGQLKLIATPAIYASVLIQRSVFPPVFNIGPVDYAAVVLCNNIDTLTE
jgi:hypothetical protein